MSAVVTKSLSAWHRVWPVAKLLLPVCRINLQSYWQDSPCNCHMHGGRADLFGFGCLLIIFIKKPPKPTITNHSLGLLKSPTPPPLWAMTGCK